MKSLLITLSSEEQQRYLRQILLDEVGAQGQEKLKQSSVLCVGAGGLGCPALLYLVAAGVGRIGIVDADTISLDNLQRQILFSTGDVGQLKVSTAKQKLLALNSEIQIDIYPERFTAQNAEKILSQYDAIIDATDNFSTRYLINDVSIKLNKPNFFGSVFKFTGQIAVFDRQHGCYRCLFPEPPIAELAPDCSRAGVFGVLPGLVGSYQALEFLKWRLGVGELLKGKILTVDVLSHQSRILRFSQDSHCPVCSQPEKILLQPKPLAGSKASTAPEFPTITASQLKAKIDRHENFFLLDVREPIEHELGHIGGTLIPSGQLTPESSQLPKDFSQKIVTYCHSGARSARVCELLRTWGYQNVLNLEGGLIAWKKEIDSTLKI